MSALAVERSELRMTLAGPSVPVAGPPRRARNSYEAGQHVRRTLNWNAPTTFPNDVLYNLTTLRDRSRAAARNDGYGKGIIDKLVANIIGTGIKPLSKARDKAFRTQVQERWLRWTDESDADGLLDWYGQQGQAVRGWLEGGEIFVRLRPRLPEDGLTVPLQVQVIEPELCPHTYNQFAANGNRIRAGIEFNPIGKRVAYYFYQSRPGDVRDIDYSQLRRVPAEFVIHLYDPLRAGQLRGIPHLTQALVRLHEFKKFDDATLLKQQIQNLFVGFVTRAPGNPNEAIHPLTGEAPDTSQGPKPLVAMEPATFQELEDGEKVEFSEPPNAGATYKDFMRQQLMGACASAGVPYELVTGDMSGLNDRVVRVILNEFAGRIEAWQHAVVAFQLCRSVWHAWLYRAYLTGALPIPDEFLDDRTPWAAVKFTPPRRRYIHPVQDVEAQERAIRDGFTSRSAVVSEWGEDAEAIDQEQADDNARADELELRYDSDARNAKNAAAQPQREPEPEGPAGAAA